MNSDAISLVAIIVLIALNAWQWNRYERALLQLANLQSIINVYRDKSGPVWGGMEAADDALPEEL